MHFISICRQQKVILLVVPVKIDNPSLMPFVLKLNGKSKKIKYRKGLVSIVKIIGEFRELNMRYVQDSHPPIFGTGSKHAVVVG